MADTLASHLAEWLGAWPGSAGLHVVGSPKRAAPGWDGALHPVVAVAAPGSVVLSVAPSRADAVGRAVGRDPRHWRDAVPALVGETRPLVEMAFRFTVQPVPLPDAGVWLASDDPALPGWLRPFGGDVLAALDADGRYLAGVGIKRHDAFGHELAVGTDPAARGAGLARRLVAQAARAVLAGGAVPTYAHELGNVASARVADAAGLPDRGWRILRLAEVSSEPTVSNERMVC
jgi:GNAT superfamily N-acetyltransferase